MSDILVTGATGTFGAAIVEGFRQVGRKIRVLVRDPLRFAKMNEEVAIGDFTDPASLEAAMSGIDRVFLASFDRPDMPALQNNLLNAAQRQGIRHIVRISTIGVDDPRFGQIMANHLKGEQQLEDSGLAFTHLRPSWVLQNYLPTSAFTPVRDGKISLPAGNAGVGFVDARDVAAVAVAALTKPGHDGRTYTLTGQEAATHAQLAEALSAATGQPIEYNDLPPEDYVRAVTAAGWSPASIESVCRLFADMRAGGAATVSDDVRNVTGRPPLSIFDFARDYAQDFIIDR
ncbi:MAG TPA: SDR family oxidoreductase [Hyphomicrobiaceae bacterium]|nr:SDR family oxidoreductase [Hyphomicrobiaceae bacterium]